MEVLVLIIVLDVHHVQVTVHHVMEHVPQRVLDVHHVLDVQEHVQRVV